MALPAQANQLLVEHDVDGAAPASDTDVGKESGPPSSSPPQSATPLRTNEPIAVPTSTALPDGILPPPLQTTYEYVKNALNTQFATVPPHTVQRLAELILKPTEHHRFLHSYLNALDRVVSVSSGVNAYPSPVSEATTLAGTTGTLPNGVHPSVLSASTPAGFGSDESLGGALLTPIPWLHDGSPNDTISRSPIILATTTLTSDISTDGSSSAPGIAKPTDSSASLLDNDAMDAQASTPAPAGVTQGELLRQQQQASSPPAPVSSLASTIISTSPLKSSTTDLGEIPASMSDDSEQPHARGPETIGMEDTGKQEHGLGSGQVLDMEAAVGRPATARAKRRKRGNGSSAEGEDRDGKFDLDSEGESEDRSDNEADGRDEDHEERTIPGNIQIDGGPTVQNNDGKDNDGDDDMPDADAAKSGATLT